HGRRRLDQPGDVAVPRGALDEIGAAVHEAVERHVPRRRVGAPHVAQAAAALLGEADLRDQAENPMALIEEAERAGLRAARLEDGAQRGLERVLGCDGRGGDLPEPLAQYLAHRAGPHRRRRLAGSLRRDCPRTWPAPDPAWVAWSAPRTTRSRASPPARAPGTKAAAAPRIERRARRTSPAARRSPSAPSRSTRTAPKRTSPSSATWAS